MSCLCLCGSFLENCFRLVIFTKEGDNPFLQFCGSATFLATHLTHVTVPILIFRAEWPILYSFAKERFASLRL
jgi:hypothetical protein